MSIYSNAASALIQFEKEVNCFCKFLGDMKVEARGYKVSPLLLASQCQDFSIGLLSLKDSLVLSSRLTLLRGLYEASMRLNYVAIEGEAGALNLEYSDLRATVKKFDLAKKKCPRLQCSQIENHRKRLTELKRDSRQEVKFSDVLEKIVEAEDPRDYWLYRYWSGFAHSELFVLSSHAVKSNLGVDSETSLTCSSEELADIYQFATSMLERAGNCLVHIFKIGSDAHASE